MTVAEPRCSARKPCGLSLRTGLPAAVRLALGGLLVLAGTAKLADPLGTYYAVNAFHMGIGERLTQVLAKVVPWSELIAGSLLVLGLWARGAAVLAIVLLAGFIAGIVSVMGRGMDVRCGCFGSLKLFCGDRAMGVCHLVRNSIMIAGAAVVLLLGPGLASLDSLRKARAGR